MLNNQPNPYMTNPYLGGGTNPSATNPYSSNPYMPKQQDPNILMDEKTLKDIVSRYKVRPRAFNDRQISMIKYHAAHYNVPFAEDEQTWGDRIGAVVKQAVTGYISGFTTINVGGEPQTPAESIARSVGSLVGFVGYLPGAPIAALGRVSNLKGVERAGEGLAKLSGKYSIPLLAGDAVIKKGSSVFKSAVASIDNGSGAIASSIKFLQNPAVADTIHRGARLGIASAVGSWQGGIDEMAKSFAWGAVFGSADVVVANLVRLRDPKALAVVKGAAGAMLNGLPATIQGQTTPEQVYQYLLGAYFGATERPWEDRYSSNRIVEWRKSGKDRIDYLRENPIPKGKALDKFMEISDTMQSGIMSNSALGEALRQVYPDLEFTNIGESLEKYRLESIKDTEPSQDSNLGKSNRDSSGKNSSDPFVPLTKHLDNIAKHIAETVAPDEGFTKFNQYSLATESMRSSHEKAVVEWEANKDKRNFYLDKMKSSIIPMFFSDTQKLPTTIEAELNSIARAMEKEESVIHYNIIRSIGEDGKLVQTVNFTSPGNNKDPNGDPLGEKTSGTLFKYVLPKGQNIVYAKDIYTHIKGDYYVKHPLIDAFYEKSGASGFRDKDERDAFVKSAHEFLATSYGQNMYYYGGVNANTPLIFVPIHKDIVAFKNSESVINAIFDKAVTAMSESKVWGKGRTKEELSKQILSNLASDKIYKNPIQQKTIMLSNMLYEMQLQYGDLGISGMSKYFKDYADSADIVKNVKSWTKRNQLILSDGSPMSAQAFRDLDPVLLNNPMFNGFKNSRVLVVDDASGKYSDLFAGSKAELYEATGDGTGIQLRDLFDPLTRFMGHGEGNGTMKAVGVSMQGDKGTVLLKLALHNVSSDKLRQIMLDNGITHIIMKTAAKTTGSHKTISSADLMSNNKTEIQSKVFDMPWEDWKVNLGKAITEKKAYKSKMRFPTQVWSFINGTFLGGDEGASVDEARGRFLKEVLRKNFAGKKDVNDAAAKFLLSDAPTKEQQKFLIDNIDDIGKDYIFRLLEDDRELSISNRLISDLVDGELSELNDEFGDGENDMSLEEYESELSMLSAESGKLNKALYADDRKQRMLLYNPTTRRMAHKLVYNYIVKSAIRPKIGNSMELPISGFLPWIYDQGDKMLQMNEEVDISKGYKFMLGDGARQKRLTRADGKKEKLGDIFDRVQTIREYNATHKSQKATDKEDVELLRFVVARTPHGSSSSAVVMELAGFDGQMGHRIYVHPDVMLRLGGADTDIDVVKLFTGSLTNEDGTFHGIPAEMKDAIAKFDKLAYVNDVEQPKTYNEAIDTTPYSDYISKSRYFDNSNVEVPEFSETNKLYHGTRTNRIRIENGELVLRPSSNFGGKQIGISFTTARDAAKFYGEHTIGDTRKVADGASIIEVDKKYIPDLTRESAEEFMSNTKATIKIPADGFKIYNSEETTKTQAKLDSSTVDELLERVSEGTDQQEYDAIIASLKRKMLSEGIDKVLGEIDDWDFVFELDTGGMRNEELYANEWVRKVIDIPKLRELAKTATQQLATRPNSYRVWHGSDSEIKSFLKDNPEGFFAKTKGGSPRAIFFSSTKAPSGTVYGDRKHQQQFDVRMDNPLTVDGKKGYSRDSESFKELVDRAIAGGHDGVIVKNVHDNFDTDVYISLDADKVTRPTSRPKMFSAKDSIDEDTGLKYTAEHEDTGGNNPDALKDPALMFNRNMREQVQVTNVTGRDYIGQVANGGVYLNEVLQILDSNNGKPYVSHVVSGKNKYTITYSLKDNASIIKASRSYEAALNATADVTEFDGIKEPYKILASIYKKALNIKIDRDKGNSTKYVVDDDSIITKMGLFKEVSQTKQAMYGKNYGMNRNWTEDEMKSMLLEGSNAFDGRANTLLSAARNYLADTQLSSSVVNSNNAKYFVEMYEKYAASPASAYWQDARGSYAVPYNEDVKTFFSKKLWNPIERKRIIDSTTEDGWTLRTAGKVMRGMDKSSVRLTEEEHYPATVADKKRKNIPLNEADKKDVARAVTAVQYDLQQYEKVRQLPKYRIAFMNEQFRTSEGYLLNDVWDMISAKLNEKYYKKLTKQQQSQVTRKISKAVMLLEQKDDMERNRIIRNTDLDNVTIDQMYKKFKETMTPEERKLFDIKLLSSMKWGGKGQGEVTRGSYDTDVDTIAYKLASIPSEAFREYNDEFEALLKMDKDIDEVAKTPEEIAKIKTSDDLVTAILKNPKILKNKTTDMDTTEMDLMSANGIVVKDMIDKIIPLQITTSTKAYFKSRPDLKKIYEEKYVPAAKKLAGYLARYKFTDAQQLNSLVRGMTMGPEQTHAGKDISALSLNDIEMLNRTFEIMDRPSTLNSLVNGSEAKKPIMQRLYSYMFPSEVGSNINQWAFETVQAPGRWSNKYGAQFSGSVTIPTNVINEVSNVIHSGEQQAIRRREGIIKNVKLKMARYLGNEYAEQFEKIVIIERESEYQKKGILTSGLPQSIIQEKIQKINEEVIAARHDLARIEKKVGTIRIKYTGDDGVDVIENLTPKQIVKNMNSIITDEVVKNVYENLIEANMPEVEKYARKGVDKNGKETIKMLYDQYKGKPTNIPDIDKAAFLKGMEDHYNRTGEWQSNLGSDGLRLINHSILYQQKYNRITAANAKEASAFLDAGDPKKLMTGKIDFESYFPHIHADRNEFRADISKSIAAIEADWKMTGDDKSRMIKKLMKDYARNGANLQDEMDVDMFHRNEPLYDEVREEIDKSRRASNERLSYLNGVSTAGNQKSREFFSFGYERNLGALDTYIENITGVYYRNLSQTISRIKIADFSATMYKNFDKETGERWSKFMHLYAQGAAGYGVVIPDTMLKDPGMKLTKTLYHAYSDSNVINRLNKLAETFGVAKERRNMFNEAFSQKDISDWSALEAKYSLATLLARPKGMVANGFGGTLNTGISAGFGPLLRAQSLKELQKIHPAFTTRAQWISWAVEHGILEDMFMSELEGSKWAGHSQMRLLVKDVVAKLANDPEMKDVDLIKLARQRGLTDAFFEKAGWFMRTAERKLRLDSFFAHYIQTLDNFSPAMANGSIHSALKFDSPILISAALKGVKNTQFLYSAPFRPMFSTSALGKVMTRFQMYAYNSIDFRRNIIKYAGVYGYQDGTAEFERMKRLAVADMLSIAAANAFMYSIFDNNLPAPWNWMQDFALWLFGDDKEKDKAFYGTYPAPIAPLQMITPPSFRMVGPLVKGMIDNDFSKVAQYTVWTMFPFGPLAMDIKRSIDNPMMVIDKMTGIPQRGVANLRKIEVNRMTGEQVDKVKRKAEEKKAEEAATKTGPLQTDEERQLVNQLEQSKGKKKKEQNNPLFMPLAPVY